jgi:hypothetical protein
MVLLYLLWFWIVFIFTGVLFSNVSTILISDLIMSCLVEVARRINCVPHKNIDGFNMHINFTLFLNC